MPEMYLEIQRLAIAEDSTFEDILASFLFDNPIYSIRIDFTKNETSIIANINVSPFDRR